MRSGVFRLLARALAAAVMIVPFVVAPAQAWTPRATIVLRPAAWTYVSSAEAQRPHWNEDIDAPVGLAGTFDQADEPPTVYRSFFMNDLSMLHGKTIIAASLTLFRSNPVCENRVRGFEVWQTGHIDRRTNWERQPEWTTILAVVPSQWGCDPNSPYEFDMTPVVTDTVAGEGGELVLGVRASFEDRPQGRLNILNSPELRITYEYKSQDPYLSDPYLPVQAVTADGWTYVESEHRNSSHWRQDASMPVGSLGGHRVARAFYRFPVPSFAGGRPVQAKLLVARADTCGVGEKPLQLWETGPVDEHTTWRRQPRWSRLVATYTWASCDTSGAMLVFDVSAVVADAQAAGRTTVTFGLRSQQERAPLGTYLLQQAPLLNINHLPPVEPPAQLMTDPSERMWPDMIGGKGGPYPCATGDARSYVPFAPRPQAVLRGGGPASAHWQWETIDGQPVREEFTPILDGQASGVPVGDDGGAYRWRVRTEDAYEQVSEWSPWCEYVVDTTRPERSGTVAGTPYSGPTPVGGPGVPGQFTMRPNGVADVGGYYYKMDDEQWSRVDAGPDGTGTLTWTPTAAGLHQLVVVSADRADNRSMFVTFYYFVVASAG
ncbi:CBM96 family carbohydrate-binding protein [Sphaerisporangium sp. NPDC004334]